MRLIIIALSLLFVGFSFAGVSVDEDAFGKSLGGWAKKGKKAADYNLSGATYRTFRPEITPTPDGGIFISLRIDHVRGWLSSNDHAMLEITVDQRGRVVSAQSSIAIQGRSVTSDLIRGGTDAGQQVSGVDHAVKIGTDLVADISAKMLREKLVEAGRVSFPSALRHNYNLLYQSIRTAPVPKRALIVNPIDAEAVERSKKEEELRAAAEAEADKQKEKVKGLEIKPSGVNDKPEL